MFKKNINFLKIFFGIWLVRKMSDNENEQQLLTSFNNGSAASHDGLVASNGGL